MNALQNHLSTVYSQNTPNSADGESPSLFTIIPADAKMLQTYLIYCMNIGSFFLMEHVYIYTVVYVYDVFFGFSLVEILCRDGIPCIVLPPTCLGIWDWRKCCDCVSMMQPSWPLRLCGHPHCLLTPTTLLCPYPLFVSLSLSLSLSAAWCWHGLLNARN